MNSYTISYSLFPKEGKYHFSNCKTVIKGETFDEAVKTFKEDKMKEGFIADFIVEGDIAKVTFFDLNTGKELDDIE